MTNIIFENDKNEKSVENVIEEKRESLLILATLDMTKEYLGQELTVEKIHNLNNKSIEKYFNRYQRVQGNKVSNVLREKVIQLGVRILSYLLPIPDSEKLVKDIENDELVNRELSNMIGLLVLKGGRFVALASGLIQVANNIATEPSQMLIKESAVKLQDKIKSCKVVDNNLQDKKNSCKVVDNNLQDKKNSCKVVDNNL